jgi:peptidoglycan/LPS O-acetylase OafA/YrhL
VLSFAQWLAMRKKVKRAGWWIPANMLAWLASMPIIFWGIDASQKGQPMFQAVLLLAGVLFVTGAIVGAIHGAFLVGFEPCEGYQFTRT